jgi:DNA-binding PadR family transcriptional regulator
VNRDADSLLPLTPAVFHILLALAGGERHGYGIMQEIAQYTEGKLHLGAGTLYRSIKHMLDAGLIVETDERSDPTVNNERRRYYRLTNFGKEVAQAEIERLTHLMGVARARQLLLSLEMALCV